MLLASPLPFLVIEIENRFGGQLAVDATALLSGWRKVLLLNRLS